MHWPTRTYIKFLKVELLSHYGSEHFCPLSLLRAFGTSMVEEYEAEDAISIVVPAPPAAPVTPAANTASLTPPPPAEDRQTDRQTDILSKAKDLVQGVISKVLGRNGSTAAPNSSSCPEPASGGRMSNLSENSRLFWYRKCLVSPPVALKLCHYFAPTPILLNFTSEGQGAGFPVTVVHTTETGLAGNLSHSSAASGKPTESEERRRGRGEPGPRTPAPSRRDAFLALLLERKGSPKPPTPEPAAPTPPPTPQTVNDTVESQLPQV